MSADLPANCAWNDNGPLAQHDWHLLSRVPLYSPSYDDRDILVGHATTWECFNCRKRRTLQARPYDELQQPWRRDAPTTEVPDSRRSDPDARDSANPAPRDQDQ
jgi:hypothetical protein